MMRRLRTLLTLGSSLVLAIGFAVALFSAINISSSNAALSAEELLPALRDIQPKTSDAPTGIPILKIGDLIGTLRIPSLNKLIPIYEGTEPAQLKKGAGHYQKSVLPGIEDNSVIAGHRDSVFSRFSSLKRGDTLIVTTGYGKFIYKITQFRIVKSTDRTVIVPTSKARLTLSTCYPFHYVGSAPQRFIVIAQLQE